MKRLSPVTPGEILLEEFLKPLDLSMNQLALKILVSSGRISQIVNNKREITADTAYRLGRFFQTGPEFWMNLQVNYTIKCYQKDWNKIKEKISTFEELVA